MRGRYISLYMIKIIVGIESLEREQGLNFFFPEILQESPISHQLLKEKQIAAGVPKESTGIMKEGASCI